MSMSNYFGQRTADHVTGRAAWTAPTWYVALFTAAPNAKTGLGGTEVSTSGTAYVRKQATFATAASGSGVIANSAAVTFDPASASWGNITHFAVYDAASGGNFLGMAAVTTPKTVGIGDTAQYAIGALTLTID